MKKLSSTSGFTDIVLSHALDSAHENLEALHETLHTSRSTSERQLVSQIAGHHFELPKVNSLYEATHS